MTDELADCSYVADCHALREIAATKSNNLKALFLDCLKKGIIGIPTCVWNEFKELYEDEAADLELHVSRKLSMKQAYHIGAASIADKINSRFSLSPYNQQTSLYSAAICRTEGYILLTTQSQLSEYRNMDCCEVKELSAWAAE